MEKPTLVRGISTAEEFAEHIRRVEEYIAGNDPATKLLAKLEKKIKKYGPESLSKTTLIYFATDLFNQAVFDDWLDRFFSGQPELVLNSVSEGLTELCGTALRDDYALLRKQFNAGLFPDYPEEECDLAGRFISNYSDLDVRLEDYAESHGLFG